MIQIFSDGSSSGCVGPGGYGWVVVVNGDPVYAGFGCGDQTTNNLMELEGAIKGLEYLIEHPIHDSDGIVLVSDSMYVLDLANGRKQPHVNVEPAMKLKTLATLLGISTQWVRGHTGDVYNEAADSLAKMGKRGFHKHPKQKKLDKAKRKDLRKVE